MYPIPSGYDGGSVLRKVEQSVTQAEVNESAQAREDGGMKSMMDYVCSKKNVWTPKYVGNSAYPWVYQIPFALQKSLYHAGFVLKAITNKNGRCFWYSLSNAFDRTEEPTVVRRNVLAQLQTLLEGRDDIFIDAASVFLHEEDRAENHNGFAIWFNGFAKLSKNDDESDEDFYNRVRLFSLNLETKLNRKRYFFLVRYYMTGSFRFTSALILHAYSMAYPARRLEIYITTDNETVNPSLRQGPERLDNTAYLLYDGDHFSVLRRIVHEEEPQKPDVPGRPMDSTYEAKSQKPKKTVLPSLTEEEEQLALSQNWSFKVQEGKDNEDAVDVDSTKKTRTIDPTKVYGLLKELSAYLNSDMATFTRGGHTITKLGAPTQNGTSGSFFGMPLNVPDASKCAKTLSMVRELSKMCGSALSIKEPEFIHRLFKGEWLCEVCRGVNSQSGSPMVFNTDSVKEHFKTKTHTRCLEGISLKPIIPSLIKSTRIQKLPDQELLRAALVAHFLRLGLAPYKIPKVMTPQFVTIVHALSGGMSSAREQNRTVVHQAEESVRDLVKNLVQDIPLCIIADSVMTKIAKGVDVLFVIASSPLIAQRQKEEGHTDSTGYVLLGQHNYRSGFSAYNQSEVIMEILANYGIRQSQVMGFCGDNVTKNRKTARHLRTVFFNCLPHSLNLVTKKFMQMFNITSRLHLPALFVNLGASMDRRQLGRLGFGIRYAQLDCTATRWDSQLKTMTYLLGTIDKDSDDLRKETIASQPSTFETLSKRVQEGAKAIQRKEQQELAERISKSTNRKEVETLYKGRMHTVVSDDDDSDNAIEFQYISTRKRTRDGQNKKTLKDVQAHSNEAHFQKEHEKDNDDNCEEENDLDDNDNVDEEDDEEDTNSAIEILDGIVTRENRPRVWTQLMQFVSAADTVSKTSLALMEALSDWTLYAEGVLISNVLRDMPVIMSIAQGGNLYKAKKRESPEETVTQLESDVTSFMTSMRSFENEATRNRAVLSAINATKEVAKNYFSDASNEVFMTASKVERPAQLKSVTESLDNFEPVLQSRLKMAYDNVFKTHFLSEDGVPHVHVDLVLQRLRLRRVFLLKDRLPGLVYSTTNEAAIMNLLSPLIPKTKKGDFQKPFCTVRTQTELFDAYTKLYNSVNGSAATLSLVGTITNPLEFFLKQSKDVSLSEGSRMLATLAVRALIAPISSASAERAGSFLRKLAEFDRLQMGEIAMGQNMFFRSNAHETDMLLSIAAQKATELLSEKSSIRVEESCMATSSEEFTPPGISFKRLNEQKKRANDKLNPPPPPPITVMKGKGSILAYMDTASKKREENDEENEDDNDDSRSQMISRHDHTLQTKQAALALTELRSKSNPSATGLSALTDEEEEETEGERAIRLQMIAGKKHGQIQHIDDDDDDDDELRMSASSSKSAGNPTSMSNKRTKR
jgi:hypothetical protein